MLVVVKESILHQGSRHKMGCVVTYMEGISFITIPALSYWI